MATRYRVYIAGQHPTLMPMMVVSPDEKEEFFTDAGHFAGGMRFAILALLRSCKSMPHPFELYCFKEVYDERWKEWKRQGLVWAAGRVAGKGSS
jgi:hypothetical protein